MRPKLRPGGQQKDESQLLAQRHTKSAAVEVGFEPTEGLPPHTLSRRAPSATRRLHRRRAYRRGTSRCAWKNSRSSSADSPASTPATTSGRWLSRRSRTTSHSEPTAPAFG